MAAHSESALCAQFSACSICIRRSHRRYRGCARPPPSCCGRRPYHHSRLYDTLMTVRPHPRSLQPPQRLYITALGLSSLPASVLLEVFCSLDLFSSGFSCATGSAGLLPKLKMWSHVAGCQTRKGVTISKLLRTIHP